MKAAVVTCSNRSAAGQRADESGERLVEQLTAAGYDVAYRCVVPDDVDAIQRAIRAALSAGCGSS